ncbi:MAG: hypothetical protein FWD06_09815 [Oscillospiraceae bacterium]|nr:hypothetical protein [Oscillospiraceae bacterium]
MKKLTPVETYHPPNIPTLAEKPPLQTLPKRWAKNAAVLACVGVLGATMLAGCVSDGILHHGGAPQMPYYVTRPTEQEIPAYNTQLNYSELDINVFIHGGGGGSAFYVVHLTEQEMYHIVRTELEAAGLRLVPARFAAQNRMLNAVPVTGALPIVRINMFDTRRRVAVALIPWGDSDFAQLSARRFARNPALTLAEVGVFYNVNSVINQPLGSGPLPTPTRAQAQAIAEQQAQGLRAQAQDFITTLQQNGRLR